METNRKELLDAIAYKSGPNPFNSLYLGGIDIARLCRIVGASFSDGNLADVIKTAPIEKINVAHASIHEFIEFMRKHPMQRCECCGSILPAVKK